MEKAFMNKDPNNGGWKVEFNELTIAIELENEEIPFLFKSQSNARCRVTAQNVGEFISKLRNVISEFKIEKENN